MAAVAGVPVWPVDTAASYDIASIKDDTLVVPVDRRAVLGQRMVTDGAGGQRIVIAGDDIVKHPAGRRIPAAGALRHRLGELLFKAMKALGQAHDQSVGSKVRRNRNCRPHVEHESGPSSSSCSSARRSLGMTFGPCPHSTHVLAAGFASSSLLSRVCRLIMAYHQRFVPGVASTPRHGSSPQS